MYLKMVMDFIRDQIIINQSNNDILFFYPMVRKEEGRKKADKSVMK